MKPIMTLRKTRAKGNPYGYALIEILVFNYDGKGGAVIRWGRNDDPEFLSGDDLDTVLFGDSAGTRYYRLLRC